MSWLLALHSSTETLGVGVAQLRAAAEPLRRTAAFPLGRGLANGLLTCVEELLPAPQWPALVRLAVATGPGGFTGTRLTVVLARTLAQQLQLPLDGCSSFLLVARRLGLSEPTWLTQELPRRGLVAGLYAPEASAPGGVVEQAAPRLLGPGEALPRGPQRPAAVQLPADVEQLLDHALAAHGQGLAAPWQMVLPLYPTSPVAAPVSAP